MACGLWFGEYSSRYTSYVGAATSRLGWGWGWLGWGNNVHVTLLMYVLLCHTWGGVGVGWGGAIAFMLRCYVRAAMQ